jgi:hypothetical protein
LKLANLVLVMKDKIPLAILRGGILATAGSGHASAQNLPEDYQEVLTVLGKKGLQSDSSEK